MTEWKTVSRPGQLGNKRDTLTAQLDAEHSPGNWRHAWQWGHQTITAPLAYQLYEDGYYQDSFAREDLWRELAETACDVYDIEPSDVRSGLEYTIQQGRATHLQDISIRRVVLRRGWRFQGTDLVQIRGHGDRWGRLLSPGKVPFHLPGMILQPELESWWDPGSIESFYQSNRLLQVTGK